MKLMLDPITHYKLKCYYDISITKNVELTLLGRVSPKDKNLFLKELFFPKQKSTGSTVEIDKQYLATEIIAKEKKINFWFHTHPNMNPFFSAEDDGTMEILAGSSDYFLGMVMGRNYSTCIRLYLKKPLELYCPIELEIMGRSFPKIYKECLKNVKELVKVQKVKVYPVESFYGENLVRGGDYGVYAPKRYS